MFISLCSSLSPWFEGEKGKGEVELVFVQRYQHSMHGDEQCTSAAAAQQSDLRALGMHACLYVCRNARLQACTLACLYA